MTTLRLHGLAPDNFLAFLVLLGALRALDEVRPEWQARAAWRGRPLRPELELRADAGEADVAREIDEGLRRLTSGTDFGGHADLKLSPPEFRALAQAAPPATARLLPSLASDGASAGKDEVGRTPLCLMFGSGHQHFLDRLAAVAATRQDPQAVEALAGALFAPWRYERSAGDADGLSFRWDPMEDRRHAYQFGDPSKGRNKIGVVPGANRLAALGFAAFVCAPGSGGRLQTAGVARKGREVEFHWPLTRVPAGSRAVAALLAHPALPDETRWAELDRLGVGWVVRCRRLQEGKYFNVSPGRIVALDGAGPAGTDQA